MNLYVYTIKQQTVTGGEGNDEKQIYNSTTESSLLSNQICCYVVSKWN